MKNKLVFQNSGWGWGYSRTLCVGGMIVMRGGSHDVLQDNIEKYRR